MNEIPADDWRLITAGVTDPDELRRLRVAFLMGCSAGLFQATNAIQKVILPPIRGSVDPKPAVDMGPSLVCERCFSRVAMLVNGECTLCLEGKPPEAETE